MKHDIQLQIPTPCHENWEGMRPEEQGRFCGSCCKTVVDLSAMSDREVLQFLARAGQGVCGRLAPEQLGRPMSTVPAKKRWSAWWAWLVAGLMVSVEAKAQRVKTPTAQPPARPVPVHHPVTTMGLIAIPHKLVKDTAVKPHAVIGDPAVKPQAVTGDTIAKPHSAIPAALNLHPVVVDTGSSDTPKITVLPTAVVIGYGVTTKWSTMGGLTSVKVVVNTPIQWVKDTLSNIGILPKKELTVYPNPVRKGNIVNLSWLGTAPGQYEVALFNAGGAMIQQRVMEVGSADQVDLLEIPSSLTAGLYFLRAWKTGDSKVIMRKVAVL